MAIGVPADSVLLAEKLLELVKSVAELAPGGVDKGSLTLDPLRVWDTKNEIQKVCDQLLARTMGPMEHAVLLAGSCQESQALHFVTELGIADLLGDGQVTLVDLSKSAGVEPQFLDVVMSCMIGRGYFEEVGSFGSCVYRNNEASRVLRENDPQSVKSALGFIGDEIFKATSCLPDAAKIASVKDTQERKLPAVNIAFGFTENIFEWMSAPAREWRGIRLGKAMKQLDRIANQNVTDDYAWQNLAFPIVDVGGGLGSLEMNLLQRENNRHLEFIIFDRPPTVGHGKQIWSTLPPEIASRVSFVPGDFMASSLAASHLPEGAPTYILRHVLHDWTDKDVLAILRMVRSARPGRLIIVEILLRPSSSRFVRATSVQLLAMNSGVTRTQAQMETLVRAAGFRVDKIVHMRAADSIIEAVL